MTSKAKRLPPWLRRPWPVSHRFQHTEQTLEALQLQTICTHANCPNKGECWGRGTATVLILGNVCTRNCKFCSVGTGRPSPPDPTEPERLARMAGVMKLRYLVMTSVNRDDLPDGGAGHFRDCIAEVRRQQPAMRFEILTPDFRHHETEALETLAEVLPFVFAHNVETVPSLYPKARPGGNYRLSLDLLQKAHERFSGIPIKSSIMLGLGETDEEVMRVLQDLHQVGCDRVTLGQYLRPSKDSLDVIDYVHPDKFAWWKERAREIGFPWVQSGPFVRSSYFAEQEDTGP